MPKQDVTFELYIDGVWRDITADDDVFAEAPIVIRRGQGDESPAPRPSQITATLDNEDDRFRTTNPESPLYGKAGRNTPARVAVDDDVRVVVEASSWRCRQTPDFRRQPKRGKAATDFEGGGLLQRVGQWTEPLKSAFRQYNDTITATSIGYFPCEQPRGSATLLSTVPGTQIRGFGGGFFGMAFDSQHAPPGSGPLMDISEDAEASIYLAGTSSQTSTAGWQLSWVDRLEPLGEVNAATMGWRTGGGALVGNSYGISVLVATGEIRLVASNIGGVFLDSTVSTGGYDFTQWTLWSVDAQYSGGTTTVWVNWTNADNSESHFLFGSFAGPPETLDWVSFTGSEGDYPAGSTIGHILAVPTGSNMGVVNLFSSARIQAWTGHLGELAAVRFDRLCGLKGIARFVSLNWAKSMPMGPQPVATLAEHFREIAATDDGLIFDYRPQARLLFVCRYDRYNQPPELELTPEDLPALPEEVTDDLGVHNLVTAVDRSGAAATAEDATGPLGTAPPPDGVGEYRQTVDVNLAAAARRLPDVANWWMRRGTVDLPRFPQVTVNLAALAPGRRAQVAAVDVGSVITISGFREDLVRLHVLGYTEAIGTHSRRITFVCVPDQQFDIARYDDTSKRMDSRTSTLTTGVGATTATLVVGFTSVRDAWSTTSTPYDWVVAGERITVLSMGAVTGSGPWTQTATVRRSVNGVRKRLTAGESIHMHPAQQARYAL